MNGPPLPAGVTIAPPPPELKLGQEDDLWRRWRLPGPYADDEGDRHDPLADATAFPNKAETDTPDALRPKLFACSGGIEYALPRGEPIPRDAGHDMARGARCAQSAVIACGQQRLARSCGFERLRDTCRIHADSTWLRRSSWRACGEAARRVASCNPCPSVRTAARYAAPCEGRCRDHCPADHEAAAG